MTQNPPDDGDLEALLKYLYEHRSFDFRGYKRASLSRRIQRRMQTVGVEDYRTYIDVLEANPGEFAALFDTILINVTSFLRDRDVWDTLRNTVVQQLVQDRAETDQVRVWSAGCASGEEAYSLAVLFADALGKERFCNTVKIYATDVDVDAPTRARYGRYPEDDVAAAFGEERAHRYFEIDDGSAVFNSELRSCLIFGRHDLIQDPPISKIDLLSCRNTLMYFTAEAQREVLTNLHFAVAPRGYLFLGKSEAMATRMDIFQSVDVHARIFRKNDQRGAVAPLTPVNRAAPLTARNATELAGLSELGPIPQLVVDSRCAILGANRPARVKFSLLAADIGEPVRDGLFTISVTEMRNMVDQVLHDGKPITISGVGLARPRVVDSFDIMISPIEQHDAVVLTFVDVTRYRTIGEDLMRAQEALESAYEELQSTVEELETTNEEMQSTNEELETTNEELHSTNEELETMNEELQSSNEELETMNEELRIRGAQISVLNSFLESILSSLQSAVIVLGADMEIRAWNRHAEELWGLRAGEVLDQHFLNIDTGFPVDSIAPAVRACLSGRADATEVVERAINRRGRTVDCTVTISRLENDGALQGVILVMDAVAADASPPDDAATEGSEGTDGADP